MSRRIINIGGSFLSTDPDALEFITNWELNTGVTMLERQRNAVFELYKGLKGLNTTNGTDFWTSSVSRGAVIWPYVPLTNTTANALAYELDVVSNGNYKGTFVGWSAANFTQFGVGRATTHENTFRTGKSPQSYPRNDVVVSVYSRTNNNNSGFEAGAVESGFSQVRYRLRGGANTNPGVWLNSTTAASIDPIDRSDGVCTAQRINGTTVQYIRQNVVHTTASNNSGNQTSTQLFFYDINGISAQNSLRQLCMLSYGLAAFTTQEMIDDWFEIWQVFNTNIIPGGRQIDTI